MPANPRQFPSNSVRPLVRVDGQVTGANIAGIDESRHHRTFTPLDVLRGSTQQTRTYMRFRLQIVMSLVEHSRHVSERTFSRTFEICNAFLQNGYRQQHDRVIHQSAGCSAALQNFWQMHGISVSKSNADRISSSGRSEYPRTVMRWKGKALVETFG